MASNGRDSAGNIVSQLSQLADRHLYLVRSISTGLAIAGAFLFAKSIKLTTKFTNAKGIPEKFIRKNVKLQGKLRCITEQGLEVEHIPITLPIVSFFQKKWHSDGSLLIRLAGVELTGCGKIWLRNRLHPSQMLWFQLLSREDSVLDCFILVHRRGLFNECLNVEILRQGLGKVSRVPRIDEHPTLWKFYKRLLQAEVKAQKKGKGMWKRESQLNMLTNKMLNNNIVQKLKQLASNIVNYWKKYRT
ncbi:protein C3orf33 homolog [Spea bombifrons]|uniref:protein C3orf33 homolog n=1 Tax=Spea bombifrons TaxID=233779 RepID=UPI00234AB2AC|nr:protein C3orf33 homolog [Spea bombifrons]